MKKIGVGISAVVVVVMMFVDISWADPSFNTVLSSLTSTRERFEAVNLQDGTVLITGGVYRPNGVDWYVLDTAELYNPDPLVHSFATTTGNMISPRTGHSATVLQDGTVLIAGGSNRGALNTAEIYNPITGVFSVLTATMSAARTQHSATLLLDGTVLIAGGEGASGSYLDSAEIFDPVAQTFTPLAGKLANARARHTATLLNTGNVLIVSGVTATTILKTAEVFNGPDSSGTYSGPPAFTATTSLTSARYYHTATLLQDGTVLVAGGVGINGVLGSFEVYDAAGGAILHTGAMAAERRLPTATLLLNGNVLIAGGAGFDYGQLDSAEIYIASSQTCTPILAPMNGRREWHQAALLPDGTVLIAGGNYGKSLKTAEIFDAALGTATTTTVVSSPNPSEYGQNVTLVAMVTAGTGSIFFKEGMKQLGIAPLSGLTATLVYSPPPSFSVGTHVITALYSGDDDNAMSKGTVSHVVTKGTTTTTIAASNNPSTFGNTLLLTATVTRGTGSVTFYDSGVSLGAASLQGRDAIYSISPDHPLSTGTHTVTAIYSGDSLYSASTGTNIADGNGNYNMLTISKADLYFSLTSTTCSGMTCTYDGQQKVVSQTILNPLSAGTVTYTTTYDNLNTPPTNAGTYAVVSTVTDSRYQGTQTGTLVIAKRPLTVSLTSVQNKIYDGTRTATGGALANNSIGSEVVCSAPSTSFSDSNVGNNKTVTASVSCPTVTSGSNYSLLSSSATMTANITQKQLTVAAGSISAGSKVYDRSVNAVLSLTSGTISLIGIVGDDDVHASGINGTFSDRLVGNSKTVAINSISLAGAQSSNYYTSSAGTTTANITPASLTISNVTANKVYDGLVTVAMSPTLAGVISGDTVTAVMTGSFANKNVGTNKPIISIATSTLSGPDKSNYSLNTALTGSSNLTGNITPKTLSFVVTAASKTYDGTLSTSATFSTLNTAGTDSLVLSGTASFTDKNAGGAKPVNVIGITLTGPNAINYMLSQTISSATATINRRPLGLTVVGLNKIYDGTTAAPVSFTMSNLVTADTATSITVGSTANFSTGGTSKNVGTSKTISVTGIALSGPNGANYIYSGGTKTATATIVARPLTVTATAADKTYSGTTSASATLLSNKIEGDAITLSGTAAFDNALRGTSKTVLVTGIHISAGADRANYTLTNTTTAASASIH